MNQREVALEFLNRFCSGNVEGLSPLLSEDLELRGPLFQLDSRTTYLNSLQEGGLEQCTFKVHSLTSGEDEVAVFYDYQKAGGTVTIGQLFGFDNDNIRRILLVFDTRPFFS